MLHFSPNLVPSMLLQVSKLYILSSITVHLAAVRCILDQYRPPPPPLWPPQFAVIGALVASLWSIIDPIDQNQN
jgi:hypothetical protein